MLKHRLKTSLVVKGLPVVIVAESLAVSVGFMTRLSFSTPADEFVVVFL